MITCFSLLFVLVAKCGGTIRDYAGHITSPHFKEKSKYPQQANCTWKIVGKESHFMTLNFEFMDIENLHTTDCPKKDRDYIKIYEKLLINSTGM